MKVSQVTRVGSFPFINVFAADYNHNGKDGKWYFASRHQRPGFSVPDGVVIVPRTKCKKSGSLSHIVIEEFRVPIGKPVISFPAGLMDPGEPIEAAAARELKEETGLNVDKVEYITPPIYSSPGLTDECLQIVYANVSGDITTKGNDSGEDIKVMHLKDWDIHKLLNDKTKSFDIRAWLILNQVLAIAEL